MSTLPPEVLKDLQKEYLTGFHDKMNEVWKAAHRGDFKTVCHYFHKFAGSGASYDMPEISILAKSVEMYLMTSERPDFYKAEKMLKEFEKVVDGYHIKILGIPAKKVS